MKVLEVLRFPFYRIALNIIAIFDKQKRNLFFAQHNNRQGLRLCFLYRSKCVFEFSNLIDFLDRISKNFCTIVSFSSYLMIK